MEKFIRCKSRQYFISLWYYVCYSDLHRHSHNDNVSIQGCYWYAHRT